MDKLSDPLSLTKRLVQCPSVTPKEGGALDELEEWLKQLGFTVYRLPFQEDGTEKVDNLYAEIGNEGPNFCFAGHTDVVPPGDIKSWTYDPFEPKEENGLLYGRGVADMKGAIACFVSAVDQFLNSKETLDGKISFLITGDEEGPAINGTKKVLEWLRGEGKILDVCLVGEPTNPSKLGEMVKNGRRGSLSTHLTIIGKQGHVAYPDLAANPCHVLIRCLNKLQNLELDQGNQYFQPSSLQITTIDVGNQASNVIPEKAMAKFNIRFNSEHKGKELQKHIQKIIENECSSKDITSNLKFHLSGDSFITSEGDFSDFILKAIKKVTNMTAKLSTSGGTSDARFIKDYCPVIEFGLVGKTMHKIDESISTNTLYDLKDIYFEILTAYFNK